MDPEIESDFSRFGGYIGLLSSEFYLLERSRRDPSRTPVRRFMSVSRREEGSIDGYLWSGFDVFGLSDQLGVDAACDDLDFCDVDLPLFSHHNGSLVIGPSIPNSSGDEDLGESFFERIIHPYRVSYNVGSGRFSLVGRSFEYTLFNDMRHSDVLEGEVVVSCIGLPRIGPDPFFFVQNDRFRAPY
jgi:hypothetical protein